MALTKIPAELSSTPGISDSSTSTAITIDSSGNVTFSGAVTATAATQSAGDNSTKIATTAYADAAAAAVVDAAPSTLDTLNELAAALGDDPNFATTVTNSIAAKAPLASPTFTGSFTSPGIDDNADAIAITIDSSENVGIGTSLPQRPLHVNGTEGVARFTSTASGNNGFEVGIGTSSQAFLWQAENAYMQFATNNTERMRIGSTGIIYVNGDGTGGRISGDGSGGLVLQDGNGRQSFKIMSPSSGSSQAMTLDASGNLGIGTSSPSSFYSTSLVVNVPDEDGITIVSPTTGLGYLMFADGTSGNARFRGFIGYEHDGDLMQFATSGVERFRIASDGSLSTPTSGTSNVRFGVNAGNSIQSGGNYNVVVGDEAGTAITTGDNNVAVGFGALNDEDTGNYSTAIGSGTLSKQNNDGNNYNTAVGFEAGREVTTGVENSIVGGLAGDALTIGYQNVVNGFQALSAETTGSRNVAIGINALNVSNSGGSTAVTSYNVAVGALAGTAVTTGTNNTFVGGLAGSAITEGVSNNFFGKDAGDTTTTGSRNICIGENANSDSATTDHTIAIGHDIAISANHFGFGKASNIVYNVFTTNASWARSSDERLKKNVQNTDLGLDFINDLRTVKYNWKANHELDSSDSQLAHLYKEDPADNDMDTESTMHGFIAQEVKTALDTAGVSDWGGWLEDRHGVQQISREMFVIPLVKAVQELSAQVTALQAEVNTLKGE